MAQQLTLNLSHRESAAFENFYTNQCRLNGGQSELELIVEMLKQFLKDQHRFLYLFGALSTGKTHLLQAVSHVLQGDYSRTCFYLSFKTKNLAPDVFENLNDFDVLCLDDLDALPSSREWEEALFDCYNQRLDDNKQLLIASKSSPKNTTFELADLNSRLSSAIILKMPNCSDRDKQAILIEWARRHSLVIKLPVITYILQRYDRDLGALFDLLAYLSECSLQMKRAITLPFVKQMLDVKTSASSIDLGIG